MGGTMIDSAGCRNSRRYRTTRTGKLFFCFNSRFFSSSSSSMNISSRSILSPARHHPLSLSASLSRRLRSDGSLKGGQSPMFPTNTASKKRTAGALENPEPTSPKVTCIGQVRVKSKKKSNNNNNKHGRKLRNPSRRRSGGDGSFRRTDNWGSVDLSSSQSNILPENRHRNQRWVHLPLTICEGLKGLGAEISCLLPCRSSSCFSSSSSSSSERGSKRERSIRSNLEEMEISREKVLEANIKQLDTSSDVVDEEEEENEEEEERLSVCVPPKNALLLMRCRSDPMRMAALSRRLLESPLSNGDEPEGNNVGFEETEPERCSLEGNENLEEDLVIDMPEEEAVEEGEEHFDEENSEMDEELEEESVQRKEEPFLEEVEDSQRGSTMEEEEEEEDILLKDSTMEEEEEEEDILLKDSTMEEEEEEEDILLKGSTMKEEEEDDFHRGSAMEEKEEENEIDAGSLSASGNEDEQKFIEEIGEDNKEEELESVGSDSESENDLAKESTKEMESSVEEEKVENDEEEEEEEEMAAPEPLPDCLLLMMCEPKVSMEVSEETWVCSTDFMRFLPERRRPSVESEKKKKKKKKVVDRRNTNPSAQPPRSSCSIPGKAAPVLNTVQKLPRCKSEPMRTAAAKLVPSSSSSETCMWKSRKVDPLRRATVVGVVGGSATGVGTGASEHPVFVL